MEMFYAANVPLLNTQEAVTRRKKFSAGLYRQSLSGRRPHFLYGTKEQYQNVDLIVLESLQHSYLDDFDPKDGNVTKDTDRHKIEALMQELDQYIVRKRESYEGDVDQDSRPHGNGKKDYPNGNEYSGSWLNGKNAWDWEIRFFEWRLLHRRV